MKTLKDIEPSHPDTYNPEGEGVIHPSEIRENITEWLQANTEAFNQFSPSGVVSPKTVDTIKNWIRHFFNIEVEEDDRKD